MSINRYIDDKTGQACFMVRVTVSDATKKRRLDRFKKAIPTMEEAIKVEKKLKKDMENEIRNSEHSSLEWGKITSTFMEAMETGDGMEKQLQASSIDDYCSLISCYTSVWNKLSINEITRNDVRKVISEMEQEGLSAHRRRKLKCVINRIYEWAIIKDKVPANIVSPAMGVKTGKAEEKKPCILTLNEIQKLLDMARHYKHPWYPIWATALNTGARCGELYQLSWSHVDMANKLICIAESYDRRNKTFKSTKGRYWRDVPINQSLEQLLRDLRPVTEHTGFVLPRIREWDKWEQARVIREFCIEIGITPIMFHTLRSCFATQLLRDKVAPVVVMKVCGWKDLKTMQTYIRLAGIEISGATDGLKFLSTKEATDLISDTYGKGSVWVECDEPLTLGCA